jgi:hypothetical protein
MSPKYKVFKELFIICWAGIPKKIRNQIYLSRVDIELINEQIKLFYSALCRYYRGMMKTVSPLLNTFHLNDKNKLLSFRKKTIYFYENGYYKIESEMLFSPLSTHKKVLFYLQR